ncbi:hypothetical protein [Pseudotabrizicola alkalilacus]|uniref:Uncharacterized protein n=1 Tax=Pseudotabrizicola alkalilacus TaxID=2305252 RepID=A0A411Z7F0_9RHOB|nr:hypothetical protein [Pseudotabrizicola alkalilacus]RGP39050.1 hypothetical protein D1012_02760 [Pseudotabrizicola alkalilacus]
MQYSTGTLTLTNGSAAVTGTGTAWVGGLRAGWILLIPGEGPLLIQSVASDTALTLARPYQGSTRSGAVYNALATRGEMTTFLTQLQTVLTAMQGTIDGAGAGKFADGTVAIPGLRFASDEDTGMRRSAANALALVTGGADRLVVTNSGAALTGLLTGTAVTQSVTDATAGRLMKVADFGLGGTGASPAITLNSATAQGLFPILGHRSELALGCEWRRCVGAASCHHLHHPDRTPGE